VGVIESLIEPERRTTDVSALAHWMGNPGAGTSVSGETVNTRTAMALSAYFASLRAISEDVAKLPIQTYKKVPRGRESIPGDEVGYLLSVAPNEDMTAISFREALLSHAIAWAGGYAEIVKDKRGIVRALYLIDPTTVVGTKKINGTTFYIIRVDGQDTHLAADRVFHIHGLGFDGMSGYSITTLAREALGAAMAAQTFASSFFGNGTWLGGVLEHPGQLSDPALAHLRDSFTERHGGAAKANKPYVVEEGMTYKQLGIAPEQAQFLETRQFSITDVARYFRMPPHKIQDLLRATFTNIEHQSLEYVGDTLMPWILRFEQEADRKLFGPDNRTLFVKHNVAALLRADVTTRGDFYTKMFNIGVYSINDIRELEDRNAIENGDDHYVAMNLAPVGVPADREPSVPDPDAGITTASATRGLVGCVVSAHCPTLAGAYHRLMRVEADKARRAHQRGDVEDWAFEFYAAHRLYVAAALGPVVEACCGAVSGARPDITVPLEVVAALADGITDRHLQNSRKVVEGADALQQMEGWTAARAEATANAELGWITAQIIDHHERTQA